jgi:undecaprenyl-phosphate 4-deoxy-4-formamido-L-arabinose transferase
MNSFVVREVTRYEGPFPYVDGLILQVTQDVDRLLVRHLPRAIGRSNYNLRRLTRLWLSMFVNFSVMPLRLSTLTGFALSAIGTAGGLAAIIEALFFAPPAGWASLMAAVMLLSGVQLVILGIVGEYLGRLYLTANGKPQSVVRSVFKAEPNFAEPPAAEPTAGDPARRSSRRARARA